MLVTIPIIKVAVQEVQLKPEYSGTPLSTEEWGEEIH